MRQFQLRSLPWPPATTNTSAHPAKATILESATTRTRACLPDNDDPMSSIYELISCSYHQEQNLILWRPLQPLERNQLTRALCMLLNLFAVITILIPATISKFSLHPLLPLLLLQACAHFKAYHVNSLKQMLSHSHAL